ncbi:FAD-dependent monooxygenase OpS4 [Lachnellula arida]|uniref:FAD-dependent monooxygenase OpS4 n=1 Tax=Lachnellula arida TaxID=1316785 RepID=A0A8T9B4Z6_9HELO|nr:FAD-dependent monooxygenase OpS4 [Lachnellula arida]
MSTAQVNGSGNGIQNGANGHTGEHGLKILIIGAGIGGLTTAIALRQQGHEVHVCSPQRQIFEQSRFANELGAAIHLAPNSNGILRRLGIYAEDFGANPMRIITEYTPESEVKKSLNLVEANKAWQHPWLLGHRVALSVNLREAATTPKGKGAPAQLRTGSKVVSVDAITSTVTLENGEAIKGDLVVGADGVHSISRKVVSKDNPQPYGSGKSAFRFLITRKAAQDDPLTSKFAQKDGELLIWYASDRRIVVYPTNNNELLNFVCIHPDSSSSAGSDTWNNTGNHEKMLEVYKDFDPAVLALLKKADAETLKVWKLLDMDILPTWVHEHLALLGDAAHPFLPHQGQGAGCAIEDAAALAVVLPVDTPREEIKDRLQLYEKIRMQRANRIQEFSRVAGADLKVDLEFDMQAHTNYNFGHDEWDNSTQALRKWTWARNPSIYWRMPIAFGPMPGPRQTFFGKSRESTESTFTTASIKFKTSRTLLQNLFPPNSTSYRFKSPGTVAYASFSQTTLNKMEWLGGSGYKHIGLYIHGVEFVKKNGDVISGTYMPLLFESLTDPIVSGREELGMPKLYTSVDIHRRDKSYRINTGWEGANWGNFVLEGLEDSDPALDKGSISGEDDDGILTYRYIPKVGYAKRGEAEAEYPIFVPYAEDSLQPQPKRIMKASKASFKIDPMDWEALPTLHHVISRLAELPVYEVMGGKVVEGLGVPDVRAAQRIE